MRKSLIYGVSLIAALEAAVCIPAFAQYDTAGGGGQTATPEQVNQCKQLGIPTFACRASTILAKERVINAEQAGAYGSGTSMFGRTFGDMGMVVVILGAIFGGVAATFFAMARKRRHEVAVATRW